MAVSNTSQYVRDWRTRERLLGFRYRTDEAIPGETFTDFKRRITSQEKRLVGAVCLGAFLTIELLGIHLSKLF